jgi:DNA repair exonuclease SbcCD ATPase subunit
MALLDLIRRKAVTAGQMKAKLEELRAHDPHGHVATLELKRRKMLFSASDEELGSMERQIEAALRDAERRDLAIEELEKQIAAAEARENAEQLTRERDAAETEAAAVAHALRTEYPRLANGLVALLDRLQAAEEAVAKINDRLSLADRQSERLAPVETRVVPAVKHGSPTASSILNRTSLREFSDGFARGWRDPVAKLLGD